MYTYTILSHTMIYYIILYHIILYYIVTYYLGLAKSVWPGQVLVYSEEGGPAGAGWQP